MNSVLRNLARKPLQVNQTKLIPSIRTFLSHAYYCNELWEHRLHDPILQKVNPEEFYQDLNQRHLKIGRISAIDVDIFANAVKDDIYVEELLDLAQKLRFSAETLNMMDSTPHAIVRYLSSCNRDEALLKVLDNRLNYGVFLDYYTANLLMDDYYKKKQFANGARVASQLMLQEEYENPLSINLGLLHCYNYLLEPKGWPEQQVPEEPEEDVKIRVKFLRNPYDDDHFDLKDANKLVGKTLMSFTKNPKDCLEKSLHLLGLVLYGKLEKAEKFLGHLEKINSDVLKLFPNDTEIYQAVSKIPQESGSVQELLEARIKESERTVAEKDIPVRCELYNKWGEVRKSALAEQNKRLRNEQRLAALEDIKQDLETRETKLWFFENQEKIDLNLLTRKKYYPKRWTGRKRQARKVDENYVPPELK